MSDIIRNDGFSRLHPTSSAGMDAHVDVRLRSHGDLAWRRDHIECTVWSAELPGFAGSIDSTVQKALTLARL
jgi:hypothetical protein